MRFRTLNIYLGEARVGLLFQYGEGQTATTRLDPGRDPSVLRRLEQAEAHRELSSSLSHDDI